MLAANVMCSVVRVDLISYAFTLVGRISEYALRSFPPCTQMSHRTVLCHVVVVYRM